MPKSVHQESVFFPGKCCGSADRPLKIPTIQFARSPTHSNPETYAVRVSSRAAALPPRCDSATQAEREAAILQLYHLGQTISSVSAAGKSDRRSETKDQMLFTTHWRDLVTWLLLTARTAEM